MAHHPPEEAVIDARVEAGHEAAPLEQVRDEVNKILDTLRSNGYEPTCASRTSHAATAGHSPPGPPKKTADAQ